MAHPMESEYVMIETFTESQPAAEEVTDAATVSSPDMDRLNQADAASTALRHAEDEASLSS